MSAQTSLLYAVASGNTVVAGTLRVDGQIDINDSVIIDEANEIFSIRNGSAVEKFGVDTDNGRYKYYRHTDCW